MTVIQIPIPASKCSFLFVILHFGGFTRGADEPVSVYKFNAFTGCSRTSNMMGIWCRYEFHGQFVVNFNGFDSGFCVLCPWEWFRGLCGFCCFYLNIEGGFDCSSEIGPFMRC